MNFSQSFRTETKRKIWQTLIFCVGIIVFLQMVRVVRWDVSEHPTNNSSVQMEQVDRFNQPFQTPEGRGSGNTHDRIELVQSAGEQSHGQSSNSSQFESAIESPIKAPIDTPIDVPGQFARAEATMAPSLNSVVQVSGQMEDSTDDGGTRFDSYMEPAASGLTTEVAAPEIRADKSNDFVPVDSKPSLPYPLSPVPERNGFSERSAEDPASNSEERYILGESTEVPSMNQPEQISAQVLEPPIDLAGTEGIRTEELENPKVARLESREANAFEPEANRSTAVEVAKPTPPASTPPQDGPKPSTQGTSDFVLAGQPKLGSNFHHEDPVTDRRAWLVPTPIHDFSSDPIDPCQLYDPGQEIDVYEGKTLNANQRPLLEIGRPWYQLGQLSEGSTVFGAHNVVTPQFIVHGDFRTAVASNTQAGDNASQWAFQWNLNLDLRLTSTERFVSFINPMGGGGKNSRVLFDGGQFEGEFDADLDFGYFEGDLGAIVGGLTGQTLPFDFPFAIGVMPLLVQNGVWMEDAFLGVAATIPARNSPALGISNMDVTFFAGFDEINSPAFAGNDDIAKMYGVLTFIEAMNGYFEIDYAFLEDRNGVRDRSYHNIGFAFSRRYGRYISNSVRVLANAGQSTDGGENTADGVLLLLENSLITAHPSTVIPYFNLFAGFDRTQSAARANASGGVLRNTGILFESDNLTGYPTLDASANDTFGGAFGVNLLASDFSQQLILECAALGVMKDQANRIAQGDQYGIGFRHQIPLSNSVILRTDGMMGFLRNDQDVRGIRVELRRKF